MTKQELQNKLTWCTNRVTEIKMEISKAESVDEMLSLLDEASKVHTEGTRIGLMLTSMLMAEYEAEVGKLTKQLQRDLILREEI